MTATLLVLVPVALLILISGFCFVGCGLDTQGHDYGKPPKPKPFTKYSETDVLPSCVAYWPLNEPSPADASGKIACLDAKGANNGEYKHKGNAAGLFPCPLVPVLFSVGATGFLSLGSVSLLAGDAKQPGNDPNVLETGMQTDGAFATIPYSSTINPSKFTVEAWARSEWNADNPARRSIVDSRDLVGNAIRGFVLWANETNNWQGAVADVNGNFLFATDPDPIALGQPAHLVFTFDGVNGALFVNGAKKSSPMALGAAYSPNATQALIIGAGSRWLTDRVNSMGDGFFPLSPFAGTIQDVAIYDTVLSDADIKKHFEDGSGKTTIPG